LVRHRQPARSKSWVDVWIESGGGLTKLLQQSLVLLSSRFLEAAPIDLLE